MASMLKKNEGIEQSRRRQRFNAHDTSYTSSNSQRIRIDINSSEEYIDFENSYLVFDLSVSGTNTDVGLPKYTASSWIKEIRVKDRAGNLLGENIQDYSVLCREHFEMTSTNEQEQSYLDATEGSLGVTKATGTSLAARQYAHRFITHIFSLKNYFPAHLLGGIQIEIDMNNRDDVVLQDSSPSGSYTIENLAYVADLVKLKPEVESMVLQQVQNGGLTIDYVSHHTVKGSVGTQTTQRFDLGTLNGRVKSVKAIQVTSAAVTTDEFATFTKNNTSNYRFKLGSKYLTESQVEVTSTRNAEWVMEYLKSNKLTCEPNGVYGKEGLTNSVLSSSKFVIGQNVDRSKTDQILSSLKDKDHNRLELELKFSSAPSAATLYVMCGIDKRVVIFPGKQFRDDDFVGQGTMM